MKAFNYRALLLTLFVFVGLVLLWSNRTLRQESSNLVPTEFASAQSQVARRLELRTESVTPSNTAIKAHVEQVYNRLPLQFEVNNGQQASEVKYMTRGSGYTLFLTSNEAVLSLKRSVKETRNPNERTLRKDPARSAKEQLPQEVVRMKLVNGNSKATISGVEELPGKVNYLIGNDRSKWHSNVSTFKKVKYTCVYPGIDLVYYGNQRQLEYDFVVSPHADPAAIRLSFNGAEQIRIDDQGGLILKTKSGAEVRQQKPILFQDVDGSRKEVGGSYELTGSNEVGFKIESYDNSKALVIDPTLIYSTYFGDTGFDQASGVVADPNGDVYFTGFTNSTDFPVLPVGTSTFSGDDDAFVAKLNASGALVYSTYIGGSQIDRSNAIAAFSGKAYLTGFTTSSDFPPVNSISSLTGNGDVFVSIVAVNGSSLEYSTRFGGTDYDQGYGIAKDSSGIYVVGTTSSTDFLRANPSDATLSGSSDGFTTKLNNDGTLVYSAYLGGSGSDGATAVTVGGPAEPFITGNTDSTDFPLLNERQASLGGGFDAFVTKLTVSGSLSYSTYHGGSGDDLGTAIAVNSGGEAYVTGGTSSSSNFPLQNARWASYGGGSLDAFVSKFVAAGNAFSYSTYLGGSGRDIASTITIDTAGNAYIAGSTRSNDFPVVNALLSIRGDDTTEDGFVTKLNSTGQGPIFSTYLGGSGLDFVSGIATTATNGTFVVGTTRALDFPVTSGAFQTNQQGDLDGFVLRLSEALNPVQLAIKGRLTYGPNSLSGVAGAPIAGAQVHLSGSTSKTVITNENGNYIFQQLLPGLAYTVTPDSPLVTTPTQRVFSPVNANVSNADFVSNQLVDIRGRVTNVNGRGLEGIRVDCFDPNALSSLTTQTDGNGNYSFIVPAGGSYTVQPTDQRVTAWLPADEITHPALTQDVNNDNFQARFPSFTVSGVIKNAAGIVFPNVKVVLTGGASAEYHTDTNGTFVSNQLNVLGDYTFTPQPFTAGGTTYNSFSPPSLNFVSILPCDQEPNLPPGAECEEDANGLPLNDYLNLPVIASTTAPVNITIQTNPAGLTVSIDDGAAVTAPVNVQWIPGSQHTIATTSPQAGATGTRYVWSSWSDVGAMSHSVTAPAVATTYTATFTTQHQLTMVAGAGGSVLPASGSFFNQGQSVPITATPNANFIFSGWTGTGNGSVSNSTNPVNVTMNGPIRQTADFAPANTIQFSAANFSAAENAGQITVTVTRGNSTGTATVDYASSDSAGASSCNTINGTASSRCDYLITLGTLNFAAGESSKTILLPVIDDVYAEGAETFTFTLGNPTGATLGSPAVATLTVNDNETSNGTNPINTASFFVRQHYIDFLNREPDTGGLNFWSNQITACGTDAPCVEVKRINVSGAFFLSTEFENTGYLVYRLYKTSFGNLPGAPVPVGFLDFIRDTQRIGRGVVVLAPNWEALLEANKVEFVLSFVQRTDFQAAFPNTMSAEEFVTALDTKAGSVLSPSEKANLIAVLGATPADVAKRASVLRSVAEDPDLRRCADGDVSCVQPLEWKKAFVLMQYFGYLRRNPNDLPDSNFDGFTFWLNKLNEFAGNYVNAEMVKAFIHSTEYRDRFGP